MTPSEIYWLRRGLNDELQSDHGYGKHKHYDYDDVSRWSYKNGQRLAQEWREKARACREP